MKNFFLLTILVCFLICLMSSNLVFADEIISADSNVQKNEKLKDELKNVEVTIVALDLKEVSKDDDENADSIADPFYYLNFGMFYFNDFLQIYALEPVSTGYKNITPEFARVGVVNFFSNLQTPINVFNKMFQLKPKESGLELLRLVVNSTIGVAGFYDAADDLFGIKKNEASFGQTLGYYGIGHGIYIVWPILGPSSARETIGFAGDKIMSPATYLGYSYLTSYEVTGITAFEKVNQTSFQLGNYKFLVGDAIEPYDALKNAFEQYTIKQIKKIKENWIIYFFKFKSPPVGGLFP